MPKETADERATAVAERRENAPAEQPETPPQPKPGEVVRTDGGISAQKDILGGGIKETLNVPITTAPKDRTRLQQKLLRAAKAKGTQKLMTVTGRPLDEWGLFWQGDKVVGHHILVDLDSLEKVEIIDEYTVEDDRIFANAQQLPKLLMNGDALKEL